MSADSRRKCRVQGAWSRPGTGDVKSGVQTCHHGQMLNNQALLFRDPKEILQEFWGLLSADSRRKCRVQGAWSRPGTGDVKSGVQTCHHGQMLNNQALLFRDPKEDKMAGQKPYNFSWVIPGLLAGSGLPQRPAHTQYILDENINILVSLTEWKPDLYLAAGLHHVHLPVEEFAPPSLPQAIEFVSLVEEASKNKQAVAVHCHWGRGRTGTLIACYLVKAHGWNPVKAITYTRQARPHSVETSQQEQLVVDYHQYLQQSS